MIANCDLVFDENYLENCFSRLQKTPCAAICGKLKIYNFETQEKTNLIDSTGLEIFKNRRVVDANQGVEDKGQFDVPKQVFGISGTCPIYRVAALQKAEIELGDSRVEVFDEDFFMYKEDIDLSWRLNLLGEQIFYEPSAVAWHVRGTGILRGVSHYAVLRDRRKTNAFTKFLALKNQRLMLIKNEYWVNFFLDAPRIFLKEFLVFSYVLFCEILLLKAYLQAFVLIPKCLKKRKQIMRKAKISALEMRRFFN
jgi:GT2 family glycosyltransferase